MKAFILALALLFTCSYVWSAGHASAHASHDKGSSHDKAKAAADDGDADD